MQKIANVAIMALLNAELMTIGFDEQKEVKIQVDYIRDQCYGSSTDRTVCWMMPKETKMTETTV